MQVIDSHPIQGAATLLYLVVGKQTRRSTTVRNIHHEVSISGTVSLYYVKQRSVPGAPEPPQP